MCGGCRGVYMRGGVREGCKVMFMYWGVLFVRGFS